MKKTVVLISVLFCLLSCNVQKIEPISNIGNYLHSSKSKGFYTLQLNADSTFKFVTGIPWCKGKWEVVDKIIILRCDEEDTLSLIARGYMETRYHELQLLSRNRLKFNDVILKRKN